MRLSGRNNYENPGRGFDFEEDDDWEDDSGDIEPTPRKNRRDANDDYPYEDDDDE